ncbi:hypothetical protein [Aliicoccus persicus]|uniref:Uncharacterized protein n=1 Tax=Aliicoccus persicus TaxID=930138 RepID=A0A662Z3C6_9STAP|nr:hypothetical protein [Aliicoccus persicus]SEV79610.1 hypothetical protein SAMN05192557_0006 [Aliicoccus persicus]
MIDKLKEYNYTKLYIFLENNDKKFVKRLNSDEVIDVDEYQYKIVTSVTQKDHEGRKMHLIQYEDKKIGWIELEDSMQIFRFPAKSYQVIENKFQPNILNENMGMSKDFISHFKGKLLKIKSLVEFNDEIYFSVFIKTKFHGFHKAEYFDPLIEVEKEIEPEELNESLEFYKFSNLTQEESEVIDIDKLKVTAILKQNKIAKVLVNGSLSYWVDLSKLPKVNIAENNNSVIQSDIYYDDIIYSINDERNKTKEILKSVLSAKEFVSNKKKIPGVSSVSDQFKIEELNEELKRYKNDNLDLSRQVNKLYNENKLTIKRLEHQLAYKQRLEEQRDRYKSRMTLVEEKLRDLDEKYKNLKNSKK